MIAGGGQNIQHVLYSNVYSVYRCWFYKQEAQTNGTEFRALR